MWKKINLKGTNFLQKTESEFLESRFKSSNSKAEVKDNMNSPLKQNDMFGVTFNSLDPKFQKVVFSNPQLAKPLVKSDNTKIVIKTKNRNLKGMKKQLEKLNINMQKRKTRRNDEFGMKYMLNLIILLTTIEYIIKNI